MIDALELVGEYMLAEREFRQILTEMQLLGYGKTQSFNALAKGENPDPSPSGESWPMHLQWEHRWRESKPADRPDLVRDARTDLDSWKVGGLGHGVDDFDETAWIIADGEGYAPEEVARRYNTTPTRIRRLRLKNDRDAEMGLPYAPVKDDSSERVLYLHSKGCTLRQIEMQTGVSKSRVQRLVKEAA